MLGIQLKQVRSHKTFVLFFLLVRQVLPSCNPTATSLRATHALLREMLDSIVSHSIIERYFFVNTDVFHCNEIMCASFIYSDTTIGAAGMINLTWGSGLES